jgi:hypothetical protein
LKPQIVSREIYSTWETPDELIIVEEGAVPFLPVAMIRGGQRPDFPTARCW